MLYVQANHQAATQESRAVVLEEEKTKLTRGERLALRIQKRIDSRKKVEESTPESVVEEAEAPSEVVESPVETTEEVVVEVEVPEVHLSLAERIKRNREARIQERLARRKIIEQQVVVETPVVVEEDEVASQETESVSQEPEVVSQKVEVVAQEVDVVLTGPTDVTGIDIQHDGNYSGRGWEKVAVQLTDSDGNLVNNPKLERDIHLRTAYGDAEFRPAVLSPLDFIGGEAEVYMLPRGRRTIVIQVQPFLSLSRPMAYSRD
tara:strand:- start:212 stop:997 length:786 start_codon:yes stop_codon:yes gene_type:complete